MSLHFEAVRRAIGMARQSRVELNEVADPQNWGRGSSLAIKHVLAMVDRA
jgi:hypothetical protein